jgi:hypothetical protein
MTRPNIKSIPKTYTLPKETLCMIDKIAEVKKWKKNIPIIEGLKLLWVSLGMDDESCKAKPK